MSKMQHLHIYIYYTPTLGSFRQTQKETHRATTRPGAFASIKARAPRHTTIMLGLVKLHPQRIEIIGDISSIHICLYIYIYIYIQKKRNNNNNNNKKNNNNSRE